MHSRLSLRLSRLSLSQKCFSTQIKKPLPTSTDRFQEKAFKEFKKLEIQRNSTILLCVSGGCDSVAMLHFLGDIRKNYLKDLDLKVVNFNHKMRPESDQEVSSNIIIFNFLQLYFNTLNSSAVMIG